LVHKNAARDEVGDGVRKSRTQYGLLRLNRLRRSWRRRWAGFARGKFF
jgi:hypothetical protein